MSLYKLQIPKHAYSRLQEYCSVSIVDFCKESEGCDLLLELQPVGGGSRYSSSIPAPVQRFMNLEEGGLNIRGLRLLSN
jgi:hypothetical protein